MQGVVAIILTWFIAPVLTGLVSAVVFLLVRTLVLRRKAAYTISFWLFPLLVLITVFINVFFVFTKVSHPSSPWQCHFSNGCSNFAEQASGFLQCVDK